MTEEDWDDPGTRCVGLRMAGDAIDETDEQGNAIADVTLLALLNAYGSREGCSISLAIEESR